MADEGEQSGSKYVGLRSKVLAICEGMIERVYTMPMNKLSVDQMKNVMFVVREAWYLSNDRFGEMTIEEFEKLQAMFHEEDDEELLGSAEEDDDPFGLRDK